MITTNLPQFVEQLTMLGDVHVHDSQDTIEIQVAKPVDVDQVDDLVCDALFADPVSRKEDAHVWTVELIKRSQLRGASDMRVVQGRGKMGYELRPAA